MGSSLSLRSVAFALLSWLAVACSGAPEVVNPGDQLQNETAGDGAPAAVMAATNSTPAAAVATGSTRTAATPAKKTCDSGECGPVADGCGGILKCGGCTAPETCGGSGVPSHCGEPEVTEVRL